MCVCACGADAASGAAADVRATSGRRAHRAPRETPAAGACPDTDAQR